MNSRGLIRPGWLGGLLGLLLWQPGMAGAVLPPTAELPLPDELEEEFQFLEDSLEVTVASGSKPTHLRAAPGAVMLITKEEIRLSGARDLHDVLMQVPGFQFGLDVYSDLFLGFRGVWAAEGKILVLVDGHEMFDLQYSNTLFINRIPLDQIEQIEINRGPGSAVYGLEAELAVINIVLRKPEQLQGPAGELLYGQMASAALRDKQPLAADFARRTVSVSYGNVFPSLGNLSLRLGLFAGQGQMSDRDYTDLDGTTFDMTGTARRDPFLLLIGTEWSGWTMRYLLEFFRTSTRDGYDTAFDESLPVNFTTHSLLLSKTWQLPARWRLIPFLRLTYQEPWETLDERARKYPNVLLNIIAHRARGGITSFWEPLAGLDLSAGFESTYDHLSEKTYGYQNPNNPGDPDDRLSEVSYWKLAGFAQALWETSFISGFAGARYEHHNQAGGAFVPRAGLVRQWGPVHAKLLFSQGFRFPSPANFGESPGLRTEKTTVYELETGLKLGERWNLQLNLFDVGVRNPIVYFYEEVSNQEGYRNETRTGARGVEAEVRFQAQWGQLNLSYSFYDATSKNEVSAFAVPGKRNVLLGFSPHKLSGRGTLFLVEDVSLSLSGVLLSDDRFGFLANDSAGNRVLSEFGVQTQVNAYLLVRNLFRRGWYLGCGIFNLLDSAQWTLQPYDNGHPPQPGLSREFTLRLGYEGATR